jgi:copper(I)-binding protein
MTLLMMRVIATALVFVLAVGIAAAQKQLSASKGWVKAPAAGETSALAFALVDNPTMYDVYLVSAASDVADRVEFRRGKPGAPPEPVANLTAPAYGAVELKADGVYLLLDGLKRALKAGETIVITLSTDSGVAIAVTAEVRP